MKKFNIKKFNLKKWCKRGVTIVEAVVAMTIMTIVTVSAISTMELVSESTINDKVCDQARITASNALECFKYADNIVEFKSLFREDLGTVQNKIESENYVSYTYGGTAYSMTITVNYDGGIYSARALDKHNKELFNISYSKG